MAASTFALLLHVFLLSALPLVFSEKENLPNDAILFQPGMVELINSNPDAGWVAGYNDRVHKLTRGQYKGMLGAYRHPPEGALPRRSRWKGALRSPTGGVLRGAGQGSSREAAMLKLPKNFDSREKWSHCPTIAHIRDQGHCGSCWAFGAVEVLSDRFCIHTNESVDLSTEDLLSCCGVLCGDGCDGGWPYKAFQYFVRSGVVTESCQPYFDQQGCKHPGCEPLYPTPKCLRKCVNKEGFKQAKHFALDAFAVEPEVEEIMAELYENGPLEVDFDVYEDFAYYKSGVYRHVVGDIIGGHAVKLIGWGTTEEGVDYWLIANSWNKSWGEDGYFRIVRGNNECEIEEDAVGGLPKKHAVSSLEELDAVV